MTIFELFLTTFELSVIFLEEAGEINEIWLEPSTLQPSLNQAKFGQICETLYTYNC